MQFAALKISDDKYCLVDACEVHALNEGLEALNDHGAPEEESLAYKMVYGRYMPEPDCDFPASEIKRHIQESVDKWLVHLSGLDVVYMGIKDIELLDNVALTASCGHCPKPHPTKDIAFAALIQVPKGFEMAKGDTRSRSAYLRWHNMDILTNLLNRMGLFAFSAEEKRFKQPLSESNWKERIDYKRAVRVARKVR